MRFTPRTDAAEWDATGEKPSDGRYFQVVDADFARQLERESLELAGELSLATLALEITKTRLADAIYERNRWKRAFEVANAADHLGEHGGESCCRGSDPRCPGNLPHCGRDPDPADAESDADRAALARGDIPAHLATPSATQPRCNYCGFPMDTPKAAHDFIHQQGEALVAYRGEITRLERDAARLDFLLELAIPGGGKPCRDVEILAPGEHGGKPDNWLLAARDSRTHEADEWEALTLREAIDTASASTRDGAVTNPSGPSPRGLPESPEAPSPNSRHSGPEGLGQA